MTAPTSKAQFAPLAAKAKAEEAFEKIGPRGVVADIGSRDTVGGELRAKSDSPTGVVFEADGVFPDYEADYFYRAGSGMARGVRITMKLQTGECCAQQAELIY